MCTKRQVATLEQQKLTATGLGGSLGQCEGHGRDKAGSTPPVVPGAAPALAKAGVGGYRLPNICKQNHMRTHTQIYSIYIIYTLSK